MRRRALHQVKHFGVGARPWRPLYWRLTKVHLSDVLFFDEDAILAHKGEELVLRPKLQDLGFVEAQLVRPLNASAPIARRVQGGAFVVCRELAAVIKPASSKIRGDILPRLT